LKFASPLQSARLNAESKEKSLAISAVIILLGVALPSSFNDDETFLIDLALRQGNIMPFFGHVPPIPTVRKRKCCKICLATGYRMCNTTLASEAKYFDISLSTVLNYSLCTASPGCSTHVTGMLHVL